MLLESRFHEHSVFSTFTYEVDPDDGSLNREHLSSTVKRLRSRLAERNLGPVRFFACGEYGERNSRPHYHAALFGLNPEWLEHVDAAWHGLRSADRSAPGFTWHGSLTPQSAAYITGYVSKKLGGSDQARAAVLAGRTPEFVLMSRRPGIGLVAVPMLVEALTTREGSMYLALHKDVPTAFQIDGRLMPLGGYLRRRLREVILGDARQPAAAKELHEKQFFAKALPFVPSDASPTLRRLALNFDLSQAKEAHTQHVQTLEAKTNRAVWRTQFHNSKRKL